MPGIGIVTRENTENVDKTTKTILHGKTYDCMLSVK